jgi:hypothetical protein
VPVLNNLWSLGNNRDEEGDPCKPGRCQQIKLAGVRPKTFLRNEVKWMGNVVNDWIFRNTCML